jgi:peptide/nickel transport system substrate-binding protein
MDAAAAASSDDAAVSHYQEAQRHRHENLPANIVWYREGALAAKNSVGGLDTVPTPDKSLFRFEEIWQDQ